FFFFFFSSRIRHTRFKCDWSSDVCSSDLIAAIDPFLHFCRARPAQCPTRGGRRGGGLRGTVFSSTTLGEAANYVVCCHFRRLSRSEERRVGKGWWFGGDGYRIYERKRRLM